MSLYNLITKALEEQLICQEHNCNITKVNKEMKLLCEDCHDHDTYQLESLFENPIGAVLWYNNGSRYASNWVKKNIEEDITTRLYRSKHVLQKYLQQLQATIKTNCQNTLKQYSNLIDTVITNSSKSLSNLQKLNQLYSYQLQEQINGNNLSFSFLGDLIYRFFTLNENPAEIFSKQTDSIMKNLQKFPYLNIDNLTSVYEEICDPFKWKLSNFISNTNFNDNNFENVDSIHLTSGRHYVRYGQEGIALYSYDQQNPLCVNSIPIDQCGQINGFKIYGFNQEQIIIFSYVNPKQLAIVNRTSVKFPTDLQYQHPNIYYKSEGVQWKWNLITDPQLLNKTTVSQFIKPKQCLFQFSDLPEHTEPVFFKMDNNFVTLSK